LRRRGAGATFFRHNAESVLSTGSSEEKTAGGDALRLLKAGWAATLSRPTVLRAAGGARPTTSAKQELGGQAGSQAELGNQKKIPISQFPKLKAQSSKLTAPNPGEGGGAAAPPIPRQVYFMGQTPARHFFWTRCSSISSRKFFSTLKKGEGAVCPRGQKEASCRVAARRWRKSRSSSLPCPRVNAVRYF
jgi:hypothetical protein